MVDGGQQVVGQAKVWIAAAAAAAARPPGLCRRKGNTSPSPSAWSDSSWPAVDGSGKDAKRRLAGVENSVGAKMVERRLVKINKLMPAARPISLAR